MLILVFGKQIKEFRKKLGLTQSQFAESVGFSFSYIAKVESGEKQPGRELITSISEKHNISIDTLLGLDSVPNDPKGRGDFNYILTDISKLVGKGIDISKIEQFTVTYKGKELSEQEKLAIKNFVDLIMKNK